MVLVCANLFVHLQQHLLLAAWGPTGDHLVFVKDNNIYYRRSAAENTPEIQITNDTTPHIFNGICDWVYEGLLFIHIFIGQAMHDSCKTWYKNIRKSLSHLQRKYSRTRWLCGYHRTAINWHMFVSMMSRCVRWRYQFMVCLAFHISSIPKSCPSTIRR